jgi:hypothetical protein
MGTPTDSRRRKMLPLLACCLLLLAVWGLWLWRLDGSDLTFDETATYMIAARPLLDILAYLREAVREHPPVYYLLMHGWIAAAGHGEFSLRLFSVCAGVLALALLGWLARIVTGRSGIAALVPVALLAVTPGMAYYARDARMYSLGVVWVLLSAGLFLRDWLPERGWPGRVALASLATVHLLALFTHYYLLLPILVQPLVLLIARRWRPLLAWCAVHGLPALAGLIWLNLAPGLQMSAGALRHLNFTLPPLGQPLYLLGSVLFSPPVLVPFPLLYSLLALTGAGIVLLLWRCRKSGVWLTLALTLPPALAYLLPNSPAPRYLVFLTPLFALALGYLCTAAVQFVRYRWPAWAVTLGLTLVAARLLSAGGLTIALAFDKSHYGRTLETIKAHSRPGDGLLFYGPWQWIQYLYYDPGGLPPIAILPSQAPPPLDPAEAEPMLEGLLARHQRLWVLPAAVNDVDPPHYAEGWLKTHAHAVWATYDFSLYLPPLPPDGPVQHVGLTFGQTLSLEQVGYEPQPVPAGEPLRLTLYWKPLARLENDVQLTLSLIDRAGQVWDVAYSIPGEWAALPATWQPGQVIADYEGLMVPQGAPPGEYVVRLRVDDLATGESLLAEGEKDVDLLVIQVTEPIYPPVLYGLPGDSATFCSPAGDGCLTLAGYEPGGMRFQQGYPAPFTLHWLVPENAPPQVQIRLRAAHRSWLPGLRAAPIVTRSLSLPAYALPATPTASTSVFTGAFRIVLPLVCRDCSGQPALRLLTMPDVLQLPPDAATGPAQVTLEVLGPDGVPWPAIQGDPAFSLFNFTIDPRPVLRRLPGGMTRVQADFGEVGLRGYRVEGDSRPGGEIRVTYIWYARTRPTAIYAVFNHLLAADGARVAQVDGWPQGGRMLTTQWQPGEYIEDGYTLTIPADAPPGPYALYVGLYNAANNERQPAFLDGQRLPDDRLSVPIGD